MKPRTTLMLAAILLVLVGIASLFNYSQRKSLSPTGKPIFPAFSAAKTDAMDIEMKNKTVKLRKPGAKWVVATEGWHEADPKLTQQILDGVGGFTTASLISTSAAKQSEFEVDSTGIRVRLMQGSAPLADFVVGKAGQDFQSTYIRPVKENRVYLVPVYLRSLVDRGDQTWRRELLLDIQSDAINSYTTKNPKETVSLEKQADGSWKMTAPEAGTAKTDILSFALRSLSQIRASGFADSTLTPEAAGLVPDTTTIVLKTTDGSTHTITIGKTSERNQSYTKVDDDPTIYLVPRGRWNTVFRPSATLRAEEPKAAGS